MLLAAGDPYKVNNKNGVIVRAGISKTSELCGELEYDRLVAVDGYGKDEAGTVRVRLGRPLRGWVSAKLLRPLSLLETVSATSFEASRPLVVLYAVNAKVGAKWYYEWLRDVLLSRVPHVFVPVGDDFFGEAGRRRALWLPANDDDKVAKRAALLDSLDRVLVVWNDFEHDRAVIERFVDASKCSIALFHAARGARESGARASSDGEGVTGHASLP